MLVFITINRNTGIQTVFWPQLGAVSTVRDTFKMVKHKA